MLVYYISKRQNNRRWEELWICFQLHFCFGLAGIDPSGAIAMITALAMGVLKRDIYVFAITTFIVTLLMGIISSFFIAKF